MLSPLYTQALSLSLFRSHTPSIVFCSARVNSLHIFLRIPEGPIFFSPDVALLLCISPLCPPVRDRSHNSRLSTPTLPYNVLPPTLQWPATHVTAHMPRTLFSSLIQRLPDKCSYTIFYNPGHYLTGSPLRGSLLLSRSLNHSSLKVFTGIFFFGARCP